MAFARLILCLGGAGLLYMGVRQLQKDVALAPAPASPLPPPAPNASTAPSYAALTGNAEPTDPIAGAPDYHSQQATAAPLPPAYSSPLPSMGSATSVSAVGAEFIKGQEGPCRLQPYPDAGGQSIYWGHHIQAGQTFTHTMADANAWFDRDLGVCEAAIASLVRVSLTQGRYDALADFIYNEGVGHFAGSTLLRKLNAGDYAGAAAEFPKWIYSQGRVVQALVRRRAAEQAMFNGSGEMGVA